ncbi:hypothetical protein ACPPVO_10625 [Dactylosporangium sp. McL0621]
MTYILALAFSGRFDMLTGDVDGTETFTHAPGHRAASGDHVR